MEKKKHTQISANLAGAAAPASPNVATPLIRYNVLHFGSKGCNLLAYHRIKQTYKIWQHTALWTVKTNQYAESSDTNDFKPFLTTSVKNDCL
jgi:hypothetical protein